MGRFGIPEQKRSKYGVPEWPSFFDVLGDTYEDTVKKMSDFSTGFVQSFARSFGIGAQVLHDRSLGAEFKPQGKFQKELFGTDKPFGIKSTGKDTRIAFGGDEKKDRKFFDPALGLLLVASDIVPLGGPKKVFLGKALQVTDVKTGKVILKSILESDFEKLKTIIDKGEDVIDGLNYKIVDATKDNLKATGQTLQGIAKMGDVPVKAGNIRLDKFVLPVESIHDMARIVKENDDFIKQRRGVQSFEDTIALSDDIPFAPKLKPGSILNAEEQISLGRQVATSKDRLDELSKLIKSGQNTDLDLLLFERLRQEQAALLGMYYGVLTETARALNASKILKRADKFNDPALIKKALDLSGGREKVEKIALLLSSFDSADVLGKYKFLKSLNKPKATDWASWYWYTNLLSGPKTQLRNIGGSLSNITFGVAARPFAAGSDAFRSFLSGSDRTVFLGESPNQIYGLFAGIRPGFTKAKYLLKNGFTMDDVASLDFRPPEVAGGIWTNLVGRSLEATDTFFRSISTSAELHSRGYTAGRLAQKQGDELHDFIRRYISDPPVKDMEEIANMGKRDVFRNTPGPIVSALVKAKSDIEFFHNGKTYKVFNPIKLVTPFITTPANIMKSSLEASPVGFVTAVTKKTSRETSLTLGKAALGTTLLTPLSLLAAEGRISGSGPRDREVRDLLYSTGWRPNSIKIGDKWYGYNNFQPLALPLSVIANTFEAYMYDGDEEGVSIPEILTKTIDSVLQQSYLSGLSSILEAINNPESYGEAWAERFLTTLRPLSSLQSQLARAVDETVRAPDTVKEAFKSQTPGLSDDIRPRRTALGEESSRDTGLPEAIEFLSNFLSPVDISKSKDSELSNELLRLRDVVQVGFPSKTITIGKNKVRLDPDEYDFLLKIAGESTKKILDRAVESPRWDKKPDSVKAEFIKRIVEEQRAVAKKKLLREFPHLRNAR